ncbi:MAG: hypothetical protein ACRDN9_03305 [Streptosporangiaceae bacterium]
MLVTVRHCPTCREERTFEQPPCADGHGLDCPERACVECGHAIIVGFVIEARPSTGVRRAA